MGLTTGKFLDDIFIQEIPTGLINSSNTSFSISGTPHSDGAFLLFLDGLYTKEFSRTGLNITMNTAPKHGQVLHCFYVKK